MTRVPRYQPYREVRPAPFRWRLGLRPLDPGDWIEVDGDYERDVAEVERVMARHPGTAFVVLDDVVPESVEVRHELVAHLRRLDADRFATLEPDEALHPLDAAGRLVQEDLVLLVERDGALICGGGSVCFPNRWDLASKVGRPLDEIHAPVARLNDQLAEPIDRFLGRLTPERGYWRLGWGLLDTDELYQAVDGTAPPGRPDAAPADFHLRVERETLRRMPRTGCILFTIRTHLTPLAELAPEADPAALAVAVDALPDDVARYKQLDATRDAISAWLRAAPTRN